MDSKSKRIVFLLAIISLTGCCLTQKPSDAPVESGTRTETLIAAAEPSPSKTPDEEKYPGVTIDEVFPIISHISSLDDGGRENELNVGAASYRVVIKDYVPRNLQKDGRNVFSFKRREPEGYWATLVGTSHLIGSGNTEIYTVVSGPGGVCCTNYSIVDISGPMPKSIYHSEDFGSFRNPMEIFDADNDGVYELVQFDSCFRYFMDDCGSCSPEPRAYFKYDRVAKQYVPAKGIQEDFVKDDTARTEKWIDDKFQEVRKTEDLRIEADLHSAVLSHVVDLLYIGQEKKAWEIFEKYGNDGDGRIRREIKKRLSECKFYQALRRQTRRTGHISE